MRTVLLWLLDDRYDKCTILFADIYHKILFTLLIFSIISNRNHTLVKSVVA